MKTEYETEYKEWKTPELSVLDIVETAGFGDLISVITLL